MLFDRYNMSGIYIISFNVSSHLVISHLNPVRDSLEYQWGPYVTATRIFAYWNGPIKFLRCSYKIEPNPRGCHITEVDDWRYELSQEWTICLMD